MKRRGNTVILYIVIAFSLSLCACVPSALPLEETPSPTPTIPATPTPIPTPAPVIAVFGAEGSASFQAGIAAAAESGACGVEFVPGGLLALSDYRADDAAAAIVYLTGDPADLPDVNIPVYVFAARGQNLFAYQPHLTYADADAARLALESAIAYPPHLTPVRMIGLFSNHDSPAYALWNAQCENGTVFRKREFFALESEEALSVWLTDTFARFFPGMLDAVFTENGELAIAAAEKIASLGRDDIEVFSAGTDAGADRALSPILLCAAGANQKIAGERCYEEAAKLLLNAVAGSGVLLPEVFWYQP